MRRASRPDALVDVLEPDAIPAIDAPRFTDDPDLEDDDLVVGLAVGGEARAYPVRILDWHEVVNDEFGDRPVAVTYCPLCGTGLAFDRRVDDRRLTFGVSGKLFRNDLVMFDRETGTLWSQLLGRALTGPLEGRRLTPLTTDLVRWGDWRRRHPGTRVLRPPEGDLRYGGEPIRYDVDPHPGYRTDHDDIRFPVERPDDRLPAKTVVVGVPGAEPVAYPLDDLPERGVVVDGDRLVVRLDGAVRVHRTDRDGWRLEDGRLVGPDGRRVDALDPDDEAVEPADHRIAYWFAWADFFPETRISRPARAEDANP